MMHPQSSSRGRNTSASVTVPELHSADNNGSPGLTANRECVMHLIRTGKVLIYLAWPIPPAGGYSG